MVEYGAGAAEGGGTRKSQTSKLSVLDRPRPGAGFILPKSTKCVCEIQTELITEGVKFVRN